MKPHSKLKTALFLAAAANVSYASESCFPPKKGQTPLDVLECLQSVQDAQQQQIAELTAKTEKQQATIDAQQGELAELKQTVGNTIKGENILLGLNYPAYGVKIHTHWPGYTGGWARGFSITADPKDETKQHAMFGAVGAGDGSRVGYVFIGRTYNDTFMVFRPNGNVGIGTVSPSHKLDVAGHVKAQAFTTGDIVFQKDGQKLWRMFEDENGLYLKQIKTGKTYRLMLEEIQ